MSDLNLRGSVNGSPSSRSLPPARPFLLEDEDGCCQATGPLLFARSAMADLCLGPVAGLREGLFL